MTKRNALIVIAFIFSISIFFLYHVLNLEFKYDFELFHPKDHDDTEFFRTFRKTFESDNDFIQVGLVNNNGIFDKTFLQKVKDLTEVLDTMESVTGVIAITNIEEQKILPLYPGIFSRKLLRPENESTYSIDSAKLYEKPGMLHFLVSESGRSTTVLISHEELLDEPGCFKLSDAVSSLVNQYEFDEVHLSGRCLGLTTYVRLVRREVGMFVGLSVAVILVFLFVSFRTSWGLWMPAAVIAMAVLWTIGTMHVFGKPMDLISNIIPTMLLVIGVSNVIHLLTRILDKIESGNSKLESLTESIKEVGLATLLTSFTTAIGFISLTTSGVQPVIDLGIYMTLGLVYAFILTYTLFPALVVLNPALDRKESLGKGLKLKLDPLIRIINGKKWQLILIWLALVVVVVPGVFNLKVDSRLQDGLQEDHPQRKAFGFFENEFSGSRPLELSITADAKQEPQPALEMLHMLDSLQIALDTILEAGNFNSLVEIYKTANQIKHSGSKSFYSLPDSEDKMKSLSKLIENNAEKFRRNKYFDQAKNEYRIQAKTPDRGSIALGKRYADFAVVFDSYFEKRLEYRFTGAAEMMDNTHAFIVHNVFRGLVVAVIIIALIMGILYRSVSIVIISILTNLIPLFITGGLMGFRNINMQLSTSLIFIIAFGIAVDDSIHFLSKFRMEIKNGLSVSHAINNTLRTTGKAIVLTTLILCGGFMSLAMSEFLGTHYIGLYISITLVVAMLADLIFLPAALLLFYRAK